MLRSTAILGLSLATATAQRPGPGGGGASLGCGKGQEGDTLTLSCPGGVVTAVDFAVYGQVTGACPGLAKGDCGADISVHMKAACVGQVSCTMHCSHKDKGCAEGVGPTCGCAFTSGPSKTPFLALADPCPGHAKTQGARVTCNNTTPAGGGGGAPRYTLDNLRVNSLPDPLVIDDPRPFFSWNLNGAGERGVVSEAYEIVLREVGATAVIWASGKVSSNRTTYVQLGSTAPNLTSDSAYTWGVRGWASSAGGSGAAIPASTPTPWANATFSTALLEQSDWTEAQWITSPGGDSPGQ
jgi:hypothetical protein